VIFLYDAPLKRQKEREGKEIGKECEERE